MAHVVEKWIPQARRRVDAFGFGDILAAYWDGIYLIQACAGASHAARRTKILTDCKKQALEWIACGGRIEIWSWSKRKHRLKNGKKVDRWTERIEPITKETIEQALEEVGR